MVIWLMGQSGAGKTTLGKKLADYYQSKKIAHYLLDGDEVRGFFHNDLGHSVSDREMNIKRMIFAAHVLEKNNIVPIVCNISPFERLRFFAREKLSNYVEIYLKTEISNCMNKDVKNIYKDNMGKTPLVGVDIIFEIPTKSDLTIETNQESVEESWQKLLGFLTRSL